MGIQLAKASLDIGIIVTDAEASLAFYRDVLGMAYIDELHTAGGVMHRVQCGDSVVKLIVPRPGSNPLPAAPGGIRGAYGYRYFTITVTNLEEIVDACTAAGHTVAVPISELRPGITVAIVADPDGNWVEFLRLG
ncbi:MAG TPA: VOC family protein [Ilumatobacteraceae bacterium]